MNTKGAEGKKNMKTKKAAAFFLAATMTAGLLPAEGIPGADDKASEMTDAGKLQQAKADDEIQTENEDSLNSGQQTQTENGNMTSPEKEEHVQPGDSSDQQENENPSQPGSDLSNHTDNHENREKILKKPGKVKIISLASSSSSVVRIQWKKVKNAKIYYVYRASSQKGKYKKIAVCKKTKFKDKTGKPLKVYFYRIAGVNEDGENRRIGAYSNIKSVKVRRKIFRTAYVGDSVMSGFREYGVVRNTSSHRVIAKVGVGTYQFVRDGLLGRVLAYHPQRMYIMMGVNAIGRRVDSSYETNTIRYYRKIITRCLDQNRNMEILVAGVAPTTAGSSVGLYPRQHFNKRVKKMIRGIKKSSKYSNCTIVYYDMDPLVGDANHYLYRRYATGDGIHWQISVYRKVGKAWKQFMKWL